MKHIIPLSLVELEEGNYHLTVETLFGNDIQRLWVVDTGASKTVFDEALTDLYEKAEPDPATQIQSAGIGQDRLDTSLGKLSSFTMGTFKSSQMMVALIDLSHINKLYYHTVGKEICGLIGSDFLLQHQAVIDYSTKELIITAD